MEKRGRMRTLMRGEKGVQGNGRLMARFRVSFICFVGFSEGVLTRITIQEYDLGSGLASTHWALNPVIGRACLSQRAGCGYHGRRRAGYIYMSIAPFLEDFAVWRQGVPVRSVQVVRVPVYIRGALRTTRPTSLVPAMPTWRQTRPALRLIERENRRQLLFNRKLHGKLVRRVEFRESAMSFRASCSSPGLG